MRKLPQDSGQALLLILLSMAVVLTVVLSIVARSVTDITVTTKEESALRAFSAAEAGVERALYIGSSVGGQLGDAKFNAQVTGGTTSVSEFAYPGQLSSGESLIIWFVNHDSDGNLVCDSQHPCFTGSKINVCWGAENTSPSTGTTPAIEVSVFYTTSPKDYSTTKIARDTADPNSARRQSGINGDSPNNFSPPDNVPSCGVSGETFAFQKTIDFAALGIPSSVYTTQNDLQFARVRIFYNTDLGSDIGVSTNIPNAGNSLLPPQGLTIESTGTTADSNRKLEVFQGYGETPSVFDSAIYSPSGVIKNVQE